MKHSIIKEGLIYRIRPIEYSDAQFIIDIRNEDEIRNKFVHPISKDLNKQKLWLSEYFKKENDFYFVIENKITNSKEGLISIYNIENTKAEWGRWVIKKGSFASIESVNLIYQAAFEDLKLDELYSRTVKDNATTVKFHQKINEKEREILKNFFEINGKFYDAVEYYLKKDEFYNNVKENLDKQCFLIFQRELNKIIDNLEFHHIGVASNNIEQEFETFKMLGYKKEEDEFIDTTQGIKGLFISSNKMPKLELLQNYKGSKVLNYFLAKKIKMYHFAYLTNDIEQTKNMLLSLGAKIVSPIKLSSYFKSEICFLMLQNSYIIELIKTPPQGIASFILPSFIYKGGSYAA